MQYVCMVFRQPCITGTEREYGIQLHVLHTLIDHHIRHGIRPLGHHVKN